MAVQMIQKYRYSYDGTFGLSVMTRTRIWRSLQLSRFQPYNGVNVRDQEQRIEKLECRMDYSKNKVS